MLNRTNPIEHYLCLRSQLEQAFTVLDDFEIEIAKIESDPFIESPTPELLLAFSHVKSAHSCIYAALAAFQTLGEKIGVDHGDRASIGLTVDESAQASVG